MSGVLLSRPGDGSSRRLPVGNKDRLPWAPHRNGTTEQGTDALGHGASPCAAYDKSIEEMSWPGDTAARPLSTVMSTMTHAERNVLSSY